MIGAFGKALRFALELLGDLRELLRAFHEFRGALTIFRRGFFVDLSHAILRSNPAATGAT